MTDRPPVSGEPRTEPFEPTTFPCPNCGRGITLRGHFEHPASTGADAPPPLDVERTNRKAREIVGLPPDPALEALRHLFFIIEGLDQQAGPPFAADHQVKITTETWMDLVRPAIQTVRARLRAEQEGEGE